MLAPFGSSDSHALPIVCRMPSRRSGATAPRRVRVLFLVEGFTDIRFVVGLSQICELTMMVPTRAYRESRLAERVAESGATLRVIEIPGGRLRFQIRSMRELWRHVGGCDLILSQELLRGSLNANVIGRLRRTPVVTYMGISPLEYFRCRRERRQIGPVASWLGSTLIRTLVTINGRLASRCLAMGPYLRDVASQWCARSEIGLYYGVDVEYFRPADADERVAPATAPGPAPRQVPHRALEPDQPREGSGNGPARRGARPRPRARRGPAEPRGRAS